MSGTKLGDFDSAVRVVVTPTQSSYFAGEPFSVTVTFTNTRSPESVPSRASHRRGAHSVSSAPLARPPTSPGNPRSAHPAAPILSRNGADKFCRKGLIGRPKGSDELPQFLEDDRKRFLARSMSVDITPLELQGRQRPGLGPKSTQFNPNSEHHDDASAPTLLRSPGLPVSPNHPHARKHSVLDGQLQLRDMSQSLPTSPYPMSASTSTFSLALDPIAEITSSPYPPTPLFASPTPSELVSSTMHSYPPRPSQGHGRRPSQLGLGKPPRGSKPNLHIQPRTAFSSTFPQTNTELILYSYAQLAGTLILTPLPGNTATQDQAHTLNKLRSGLLRRAVLGGGSMDITSSLHQRPPQQQHKRRSTHTRSSSLSSGLLSLLSPSTLLTSPSLEHTPKLPPQSSGPSPFPSNGSDSKSGPGTAAVVVDIDPEQPLPTFEIQPAMLAVDLSLLPGESRSYTYTIPLPDNLPPTFRGRSMKFSYELIVGACRAGSPGSAGSNSVSRVMKVPIRVYNSVAVGKLPSPYDMLWPIDQRSKPADSGSEVIEQVGEPVKSAMRPSVLSTIGGTYSELQDYAQRLLASFPEQGTNGVRIMMPVEPARIEIERERQEEGSMTGCREAVELLTRNPKKVSYDVNKEGVKVAVLTFTKSAYRLGETVLGVVELNARTGRSRVLKLSAALEAHESLPSSIATSSRSRHMRRVHADHHSSFVLSTLRTAFSLVIPSDASPAFQVTLGTEGDGDPKPGGLEWRVRLCLLVGVAAESSHTGTEGVRLKSMVRDGRRGEWGSSWRAPPSISPLEKPGLYSQVKEPPVAQARSWASFFTSSFLGASEREYHDGDEEPGDEDEEGVYDGVRGDSEGGVGVGVNFGGGEDEWREVKIETVECEVPIKVWPGNTAFKAMDVEFEV